MNRIPKKRGLKRYYLNLRTKIEIGKINWLGSEKSDNYSNNWHLHFDFNGYGNRSFKRRKPHLNKLFRHFDILLDKTSKLNLDFQLYTIILDFNSTSDALFLHKPNLENSQFAFKFSELLKTTTLKNQQLNEYIDTLEGYEKLYGIANEPFCLLFKKNVGQPFE